MTSSYNLIVPQVNHIGAKLWRWVAEYGEDKARKIFDQHFQKYNNEGSDNSNKIKPIIKSVIMPLQHRHALNVDPITCFRIERIFFGDNPPKALGVRILDTVDNVVRMDWEVRYSGNPDIVLRVGLGPLSFPLALGDVRLSCKLRVEFTNFIRK